MNPKHINSIDKTTIHSVAIVKVMLGEKKLNDFLVMSDSDDNLLVGDYDTNLFKSGVLRLTQLCTLKFASCMTHGERGLMTNLLSDLLLGHDSQCNEDMESYINHALDRQTDVEWYDFSTPDMQAFVSNATLNIVN